MHIVEGAFYHPKSIFESEGRNFMKIVFVSTIDIIYKNKRLVNIDVTRIGSQLHVGSP